MKNLSTAGIETPWMQQWRVFRQDNNPLSDPRQQHIDDLITAVQKDQAKNWLVIIVGDFNEDLDDSGNNGILTFQESCNLVNIHRKLLGDTPSSRGNHRSVFHMYFSPVLLSYISKIGTFGEHDGFCTSDHIPFFVDLEPSMFNQPPLTLVPNQYRVLKMYNLPLVHKYLRNVWAQLKSQDIRNRLIALEESIRTHGFHEQQAMELDKIEAQMTEIRLTSKSNLVPVPTPYKSTAIAKKQNIKIRLLRKLQRQLQAGKDTYETISQLDEKEFCLGVTPNNLDSVVKTE